MKNEIKRSIAKFIAIASYKEVEKNVNSTCVFLHGQPEVPECAKRLNKTTK